MKSKPCKVHLIDNVKGNVQKAAEEASALFPCAQWWLLTAQRTVVVSNRAITELNSLFKLSGRRADMLETPKDDSFLDEFGSRVLGTSQDPEMIGLRETLYYSQAAMASAMRQNPGLSDPGCYPLQSSKNS